jgi:hypothetical protein
MSDVLVPQANAYHLSPFRQIEEIVGRMEQSPVFINKHGVEGFIEPNVIIGFYVTHLSQFQLQTTGKSSFLFAVSLEKNITQSERKIAIQQIQAKLTEILVNRDMDNVTFAIKEVDHIPIDRKTGKFKLIVTNQR